MNAQLPDPYQWTRLNNPNGERGLASRLAGRFMIRWKCYSWIRFSAASVLFAGLAACGGDGSPLPTYTVGGVVTGLTGTGLVLHDDTAGDLAVSGPGAFHFTAGFAAGATYAVTVKAEPSSPRQNCVVTNGSSDIGVANVTNVMVTCTNAYTIGYTVTGLQGSGLVLGVNCGYYICDFDLDVSKSGSGTIDVSEIGSSNLFPSGYKYRFSVETQPSSPEQRCVITDGSGTVATTDVTDVTIVCANVGRFAYAANAGDDTLSLYSIECSTGALIAAGPPVRTGTLPQALVASPDGMHLYVANERSDDISAYAISITNGALTPIAGSPFGAGANPQALAINVTPSGTYLYVANKGSNTLSAYAVDGGTGALTSLATPTYTTGAGPSAVSVSSDGKFVFVANNAGSNDISVFAVTSGTGALTPVVGSPFPAGGNPHSLVLTPTGPGESGANTYLYTANFDGTTSAVSGFVVDPSTGVLTALSGSPFPLAVSNYIATDRTGAYLYVTTGANVVGYRIDANTGLLTALPGFPVAAGANAYSISIDPSNQLMYVGVDGNASVSGYWLTGANGAITAISGSPFAAGSQPDSLIIL
jgi:6-phosphogluconolactonase (cycloisomerase 2 family)